MENLIAWILMAAISLPVSFLLARGCLSGVIRADERGNATRCVMIAGVKGSAVLSALLILLPWDARAADDMAGAIRELARKTVALAGRGEPVSVNWRNLSSLPSSDFNQARIAFDAAVRDAGGRVSDIAPMVDARITLSDNASQFLLVEEARKGEDRQVWISSWKRPACRRAARRLRAHPGEEAGMGTGGTDSGRGHARHRGPGALSFPSQHARGSRDAIPAHHAAAALAARPTGTSAGQRRRLQSVPARRGLQRYRRTIAHHGVSSQRRAVDPG